MERLIITLLLVLSLSSSYATDLNKVYNIIKHVESNNRSQVIGDGGRAYGIVQIHKICVADINRLYGTSYAHKQAFEESIAKRMFMLYMSAGVRMFKKRYCRSPTESEIVRMWNGGIYTGYKKKSTLKYLKKYLYYKRILTKT